MNPALRGGLPPSSTSLVRRAANILSRKAAPPASSMEVGWRPYYAPYKSPSTRQINALMDTYGGEDDGVSWVFASVELIMMEAGSWPWDIYSKNGPRPLPRKSIPTDLLDLLESPNEDLTYSDFIHWLIMDSLLSGNSYWLKDQMNAIGQPLDLYRLRPEFTQIAVNEEGRIIGYLYNPPHFPMPIPYDRDEIVHYRRGPNPRSEYYGMGVIEGIQRALEADLAETDHVVGFFADGARISGVLTTGTLTEVQFDRFRQQFAEEYAGAANAHKILVVEEGTRFDPVTVSPSSSGSGVRELRAMSKDEILSGFGVPSPMLGGTLTESTYKMEESQDIFSRRMYPLAASISERLTLDVVGNWKLTFRMDATYAEPRDHKIERAGNMLKAGATINDSRREMNLPPHPEEWANVPVIPQGFAPFGFMTSGGAPSAVPVTEGGNVNGNQPATTTQPTQPSNVAPDETVNANNDDLVNSAGYLPTPKGLIAPPGFQELSGAQTFVVDFDTGQEWIARQLSLIATWHPRVENFLRKSLAERREEMFRDFSILQESVSRKKLLKSEINHTHVWPDSPFGSWNELVDEIGVAVIGDAWEKVGILISDRFAREFEQHEKRLLAPMKEQFSEGVRASRSVRQMQFGDMRYAGVMKVYDENATKIIESAKGMTVRAVSMTSLETIKRLGTQRVEVIDGSDTPQCRAAQNAIWSVQEALESPQGHENCVRIFVPLDV